MLYRTVYGPELAVIYELIVMSGQAGMARDAVHAALVPGFGTNIRVSTQNVDDALAFLAAAHLANQVDRRWIPLPTKIPDAEFRIQVLSHLRHLQKGGFSAQHPADPTYLLLLDELYVKPRQRVVSRLLVQANALEAVQAVGGLNREKLQGWRRVMCYLGLGVQIHGEFIFAPDVELVMALINLSGEHEGSLQDLIEGHLTQFLPCCDHAGELTPVLQNCFEVLQQTERLKLFSQQDAPSRPYGPARYRGFRVIAA